ncbi:MAG: DUF1810 domain-containing protein [Candidatus Nanopelagicales bacterium]
MTDDPFDLARFATAQDGDDPHHRGASWESITAELAAGHKRGHWMWFVFPQVDLGHTPTSHHFAITSREEAVAYLAHPVLGPRLAQCTRLILDCGTADPVAIFGHLDSHKLRSSLTLFDAVAPGGIYAEGLQRFFDGEVDQRTLTYLAAFPDPE